ncbi:MAG: hypothetical protein KJ666_11290 [Bacteroidetes bacterium]|nr:hypothetical protein [Bacteroidota bacterium]
MKEQNQELSHGVNTHVSAKGLGQLRSPLDFLKMKDEHILPGKTQKLLKSGDKQ